MALQFRIERENENGVTETSSSSIALDDIRLGRGAAADIQLQSRLVSLLHALIRVRPEGLSIEDLGSQSGVRVNNVVVASAQLKSGDVIKLGDISLTVFREDAGWGLTQVVRGGVSSDEDSGHEAAVRQLEIKSFLPSLGILGVGATLIMLAAYFFVPMLGGSPQSWSSGPLATAHQTIEKDCKSCHAVSFQQVRDTECLACHKMSNHSPALKTVQAHHPELKARCAECHMDHNGPRGVITDDSRLCTSCHAALNGLHKDTQLSNVSSLAKHPDFSVTIFKDKESKDRVRMALGNRALKDPTALKLNHKVHLAKNLRGPDGPTTLSCNSCHQFSSNMRDIKPITYEKQCGSCHGLEFDERLPGVQAPHGKPEQVMGFVLAQYAKLYLSAEELEMVEGRRRPGSASAEKQLNQNRAKVEAEARRTEQMIFTKTACFLCHDVREKENATGEKARYDVVRPRLPSVWLPKASFNHGAHQNVQCDSCHRGARKSERTSDILLPRVADCVQCHAAPGTLGKVDSPCIQCHSYHNQLELNDSRKRSIQDLVRAMHS